MHLIAPLIMGDLPYTSYFSAQLFSRGKYNHYGYIPSLVAILRETGRPAQWKSEMEMKIAITLLLVAALVLPTLFVIRRRLGRRD
jgi:hypothetical protein